MMDDKNKIIEDWFGDSEPYDISLPANETVNIPCHGRRIRCITSSAIFSLKTDKGHNIAGFEAGMEIHSQRGSIQTLELKSTTTQSVQIQIGTDELIDDRINLSGSITTEETVPTSFDAPADVSVNSTAIKSILAANTARKKGVLVGALAANTSNVRVMDSGGTATSGAELQPGQTVFIETTAEIYAADGTSGCSVWLIEV